MFEEDQSDFLRELLFLYTTVHCIVYGIILYVVWVSHQSYQKRAWHLVKGGHINPQLQKWNLQYAIGLKAQTHTMSNSK